jgi:hypothetical protein
MKQSEIFTRAFTEHEFRREKLSELRYFRSVGIGLLILSSVCCVAHTLYAGMGKGNWEAGMTWLTPLAITAGAYSVCSARLAALEAIDEKVR